MNRFVPVKLLFLLLLTPFISPASAAEFTLRLHHFLSPESIPQQLLMEPWAKRIEQESGGRIAVEIHAEMALGGKATELVEQVREGTVDIIWTAAAYTPGKFPRTEVFTLPLVHGGDAIATNLAIQDMMSGSLAPDFKGVHPLLVHVHPGHAFHTTYKAIRKLEDFSGLTLRAPGRGVGKWTVEALGASPTKKRHPKLPRAMEKKALDGVLMSFQLANALEVVAASKFHTVLGGNRYFGTSLYLFLMNEARYQALPDDLRAIIDRNSGAALARDMGQAWNAAGEVAVEAARARGSEIIAIDGADLAPVEKALETVSDRWVASIADRGFDGAALLEAARQGVAKHSGAAN